MTFRVILIVSEFNLKGGYGTCVYGACVYMADVHIVYNNVDMAHGETENCSIFLLGSKQMIFFANVSRRRS